jgi:hypothetical protein
MKNAWLGYLGSFITLLGGVVMIVAGRYILGSILILASIGGAVAKYYLSKKKY